MLATRCPGGRVSGEGGIGRSGSSARHQRKRPTPAGVLGVLLPSLVAFVLMDVVWIGLVASGFYQQQLASILKAEADLFAGLLAWLCICGASYIFVLPRALERGTLGQRAAQVRPSAAALLRPGGPSPLMPRQPRPHPGAMMAAQR